MPKFFTKPGVWEATATPTDNIFANPNLLCLFGDIRTGEPQYLLTQDHKMWFKTDVSGWREQYKQGILQLLPANQKSHKCLHPLCEGKVFYGLCLQLKDSQISDPNAMMNFGWICNGYTYFFKSKQNRDKVLEWIKKPN
jgi:hypothetical protein